MSSFNFNLLLVPASLVLGIFCVISAIAVIMSAVKRNFMISRSLNSALLLILTPMDKEKELENIEKLMQRIAVMEQFFAGVESIKEEKGFKKRLLGDPSIALEIALIEGQVRFLMGVPKRYKEFVGKQLLGVFPDAKIEEIPEDYTIFTEKSAVAVSIGRLQKKSLYPINTYKNLQADTLGEITNSFSKLSSQEGAAIQLIIKPAPESWRKQGMEAVKTLQSGEKINESGLAKEIGGAFLGDAREALGVVITGKDGSSEKEKNQQQEKTKSLPANQYLIEAIGNKANQHGFMVNLRIAASAGTKENADNILNYLEGSFAQFKSQFNSFAFQKKFFPKNKKEVWKYIFRIFDQDSSFILSSQELASIFHLPIAKDVRGVKRLEAKESPAPVSIPKEGTILGENLYRGESIPVRIKDKDRQRHMYIIGKTGTGKSVFLQNLIMQDIKAGKGVCAIDPHGELIEKLLENIPKERVEDVIVFDPANTQRPLGFNLFEARNEEQKDLLALEAMSIFLKLFGSEVFGPRIQDYFRNGALTLMSDNENPGTIVDIVRLFTDDDFQASWVSKVKSPIIRDFWQKQMEKTGAREKQEMIPFFAAKFGAFITNSTMRNIIGQSHSAFNFREVMDSGKILLVSLSKGTIGEINMSLLGMIIIAKLQMAAMSRSDIPESQRRDFYLYVDEFQNFATSSFESILSEARKYKLNLTIAHQYLAQIENVGGDFEKKIDLRKSIFGNVGSIISFRTGIEDAEVLEKEFLPIFDKSDIANIENLNAYVKLLIDGVLSPAFNMKVPFPPKPQNPEIGNLIKEFSNLRFGRDKEVVEKEIFSRLKTDVLS
ncbi:MAG: type IV secretory system conjugative DNA transfer family protein [bacterium]